MSSDRFFYLKDGMLKKHSPLTSRKSNSNIFFIVSFEINRLVY
jgi:hypothetical protein